MARFILVLRWILQGSGEDCGVVSDCEELSGGYLQGMMGLPLPRVLMFEVVIA